jgi:hypothetical protein
MDICRYNSSNDMLNNFWYSSPFLIINNKLHSILLHRSQIDKHKNDKILLLLFCFAEHFFENIEKSKV